MDLENILENNQSIGLYHPKNEHDACGIAAVAKVVQELKKIQVMGRGF